MFNKNREACDCPILVQSEFYEATTILFERKKKKKKRLFFSTNHLLSVSPRQRSALLDITKKRVVKSLF